MKAFQWVDLGDVDVGRGNLGPEVPVIAYRLMEYTLRDALTAEFGEEAANRLFVRAGRLAGVEFCRNVLDTSLDVNKFVAQLKQKLQELKIGLLRVEKLDLENNDVVVTVAEDLDCSGLPATGETVCYYDEGFLAGIMAEYTGTPFQAKEIDCWATGDRVCRFVLKRITE